MKSLKKQTEKSEKVDEELVKVDGQMEKSEKVNEKPEIVDGNI